MTGRDEHMKLRYGDLVLKTDENGSSTWNGVLSEGLKQEMVRLQDVVAFDRLSQKCTKLETAAALLIIS